MIIDYDKTIFDKKKIAKEHVWDTTELVVQYKTGQTMIAFYTKDRARMEIAKEAFMKKYCIPEHKMDEFMDLVSEHYRNEEIRNESDECE